MATAGIGRQNRLCVILVKIGTPVARAVFEKRVKDLTPTNHSPSPWTVYDFLIAHKPKIKSLKLSNQAWTNIFPVQSHTVKLEHWDLTLLCCILTECCDLRSDISLDIYQLRKLRNKLFHMSEPSIDDLKYRHNLAKLKVIFDRCLKEINDDAFTNEMQKMFEDLEQGRFSQVDVEEVMKQLKSMEEETKEKLTELGQNQKLTNEGITEILQQLTVIVAGVKDIKSHSVPATGLEIAVKNCTTAKEEEISERLVHYFEESMKDEVEFTKLTDSCQQNIKEAVFKAYTLFMSKDYKVVGAEKRCLFLRFNFTSLVSLISFLRECVSGELTIQLQEVEAAVRVLDGCEDLSLEAFINTDEALAALHEVEMAISSFMENENILPNSASLAENDAHVKIREVRLVKRKSDDSNDVTNALQLSFENYSLEYFQRLEESFENGEIDTAMQRIQEAVAGEFKTTDVRITAQLIQENETVKQEFFNYCGIDMSDTDSKSDTDSVTDSDSFDEEDDLDNPDNKNWVRAAKSLEYLQQGLATFVLKEFSDSAQSTDAAGLLSVIINNGFFQSKLTCKIDPTNPRNDIFTRARDARNDILYRAETKLSEQELHDYIDLFVAVLHGPKSLLNDKSAQEGVQKLISLKTHQIHISRKDTEKSLIARKEALRDLKCLEEKKEKALQDIQATTDESIQTIQKRKSEIFEELEEFKTEMQQEVGVLAVDERLKNVEEQLRKVNDQPLKSNSITGEITEDSLGEAATAGCSSDNNIEDTKIKTDEDILENVIDVDVSLRDYQKELAEEGAKGKNVVVMAPTNTGKTRVACKIIQECLRKKKDGKVIFLVENEALALQQGQELSKRLPAYRTKVISGSVQREKKQYLKDFIHMRDILVVTAQVLLNALKLNEIDSLTKFALIVFDECHHTHDSHRYNEIMGRYMDLKLQENEAVSPLPQIVGLTASLGVGGHTDPNAAMGHMKNLLANLDATLLCTVRRNKDDLQKYANRAKEHIEPAKKRINDMYREAVLKNMYAIDDYMLKHPSLAELPTATDLTTKCRLPPTAGDVSFQNWLSEFKKALGDVSSKRVRRMMFPCWEHLEIYNKSLMIHADARIKDARAVLVEFMNDLKEKMEGNETDEMLLKLYENLKAQNFDDEPQNPKLLKLEELINTILGNNNHARGIVFVKTRELAKALVSWLNETDSLKPLNAKECVGQGASADKGGMTRRKQKNVLDFFRHGHHKLIVATSIVEEGLDITKCNLVIRYEHVTNEIVRLQSRGRARSANSKYFVLTEEGSWIVEKEKKNKMLEDLMNEIVPMLQADIERDPFAWQRQLTKLQKDKKLADERNEKERRAKMTDDVKELQCFKCSKFICMSSDIRKIQGTQHVVIDEAVQKRISWTRNPLPKFKDDPLKYDGNTFCGNSSCQQKLGGVCEYHGTEFPLISISNFRVVDKNGRGKTFKKWKNVNFVVEEFSLEQFDEVVQKRNKVDT